VYDIYLFGMILKSNSFLLQNEYPEADTYGEIKERYCHTGGETGTCATVLASLGAKIKMDGNHMGKQTYPMIKAYYEEKDVDISALTYDENYEGLEDFILIDKKTRTCFGTFNHYYSETYKRWNKPQKSDIENSKVIGLDPFFGEEAVQVAKWCHELGKPYVVIDCPYDSTFNRFSSVNVISNEYIKGNYKDLSREEILKRYTDETDGLVILTLGAKEVMYGRKGEAPRYFKPYSVEVVSTLGAGDTFKAGCVYALFKQMSDEEMVSFASATAAVACTRFPIGMNPPTLKDVKLLQDSRA